MKTQGDQPLKKTLAVFLGFKLTQIMTKIIYKALKTFHNNSKRWCIKIKKKTHTPHLVHFPVDQISCHAESPNLASVITDNKRDFSSDFLGKLKP